VQRTLLFLEGSVLEPKFLPDVLLQSDGAQNFDFEKFKQESEKEFIERALIANEGKINRTVANANIPKNTLLRKIKKYNIDIKSLIGQKTNLPES